MTWSDFVAEHLSSFLQVLGALAVAGAGYVQRQGAQRRARERESAGAIPAALAAGVAVLDELDVLKASMEGIGRTGIFEFHNGEGQPGMWKRASVHFSTRDRELPSLRHRLDKIELNRWFIESAVDTIVHGKAVPIDVEGWVRRRDAMLEMRKDTGRREPSWLFELPHGPPPELLVVWERDGVAFAMCHGIGSYDGSAFMLFAEWPTAPEAVTAEYSDTAREVCARIRKLIPQLQRR